MIGDPRLLFWDEQLPGGGFQKLLDFFNGMSGRPRRGQPRDHVRRDIARADRDTLAAALRAGSVHMRFLGWADCRICGAKLGTKDLEGHGFVWPEKAEHYVLEHDVWTRECSELLAVLRRNP
jgi:hypothetical protein